MRESDLVRRLAFSPYIDMVEVLCKHISRFGKAKFSAKNFFLSQLMKPKSLSLLLALLCFIPKARAEEDARVALLPWQLIAWDSEFSVRHRESLASLHSSLARAWIEAPQRLDLWLGSRPQSINQKSRSQTISIGASRSKLGFDAYLVPVLCPLGEQLVAGLQLVDMKSQLVLAGSQRLMPREPWEKQNGPMPEGLERAFISMLQDIEVAAIRRHESQTMDAFKLSLRLLRGSEGPRLGAMNCQNLLLTNALVDQYRVLASLGSLEAAHLREQLHIAIDPQRSTRVLALDWGMEKGGPEIWKFEARWSEGVLGGTIDESIKGEVKLRRQPDGFELPSSLAELFRQEREQLKLGDLPRIARIYKAWVYLDRGRAYGLDMNDRLYLRDGDRLVKGHVVGFFGPKAGVVSPRGFPVHEGAIVYIRKGQRQVKLGDTLNFDPSTYPAPFPAPQPP